MHMIGDEYVDQIAGYIGSGASSAYKWYNTPRNSTYVSKKPNMNKFNWGKSDINRMNTMGGRYWTSRKRARSASRRPNFSQRGYIKKGGFYGRYQGPFAQELKFLDDDLSDTVVATSGFIFSTLNVIPQGTTESERIGRKVVISKILMRYTFKIPTASTLASGDVFRIILFVDKQCNGATAAILDVLKTANIHSFRALENTGRFNILMDRTEAITTPASSGNGTANDVGPTIKFRKFFKTCAIPIEFDSTTGAITEIQSNNLGMIVISMEGVVRFECDIRLRYKG